MDEKQEKRRDLLYVVLFFSAMIVSAFAISIFRLDIPNETKLAEAPSMPDSVETLEQAQKAFDRWEGFVLERQLEIAKTNFPGSETLVKIDSLHRLFLERMEQQRIEELERMEENKKKLATLKKNVDDFSGYTWYENPYFTHYGSSNGISVYFGVKKGVSKSLRLKMSYSGSGWIFFDRAYLTYDGITRKIPFNEYDDKTSDNNSDQVWEWIDVNVDGPTKTYLENFARSPNAKMRLSGKYSKDRNLSKRERKAILDVLAGYDAVTITK